MATLLKTDGTATEVKPANGKKFTLAEAQALVGGYVERVRARNGFLLVNEEGLLKGLPWNLAASGMVGFTLVGDVVLYNHGEF